MFKSLDYNSKGWSRTPNSILRSGCNLSSIQRLVIMYLVSHSENHKVSINNIRKDLNLHYNTVKKSLIELFNRGYQDVILAVVQNYTGDIEDGGVQKCTGGSAKVNRQPVQKCTTRIIREDYKNKEIYKEKFLNLELEEESIAKLHNQPTIKQAINGKPIAKIENPITLDLEEDKEETNIKQQSTVVNNKPKQQTTTNSTKYVAIIGHSNTSSAGNNHPSSTNTSKIKNKKPTGSTCATELLEQIPEEFLKEGFKINQKDDLQAEYTHFRNGKIDKNHKSTDWLKQWLKYLQKGIEKYGKGQGNLYHKAISIKGQFMDTVEVQTFESEERKREHINQQIAKINELKQDYFKQKQEFEERSLLLFDKQWSFKIGSKEHQETRREGLQLSSNWNRIEDNFETQINNIARELKTQHATKCQDFNDIEAEFVTLQSTKQETKTQNNDTTQNTNQVKPQLEEGLFI